MKVLSESDIPKVFTSEYYDSEYFAGTKGGKKFLRPNGTISRWSYYNPQGEWIGAKPIAEAWKTMFNPKTMLDVGCVPPDTHVLTNDGYKKISNISVGIPLPNSNVIKTFNRQYNGMMVYIKPMFLEGVYFTPEHPILVARKRQTDYWKNGKWKFFWEIVGFKRADEVLFSEKYYKSDYVVVPKIKEERDIYLDFPMPDPKHGGGYGKKLGSQPLDEGWARIIGWYLAEGYVDGRMVCFALGDEPEYAEEIVKLCESKGIRGKWSYRKKRVGILVRVCSVALARWLEENCGRGAKNKHLPPSFLYWKKNVLQALIETYVKGDGCIRERRGQKRKKYREVKVTSASKRLIKEIQMALLKIGIVSSYYVDKHSPCKIEGRLLKERTSYSLSWSEKQTFNYCDENNYYFKVTDKRSIKYSGSVHNLQTTSEIYMLPFIVHNCGRGTFVAYARDVGIEAYGFDFSRWAVEEGRYLRCKREWLKLHDATKPWPYTDKSFNLVVCLDFYEHIYQCDLDFVMSEMYRVAEKYVFLQIAAIGGGSGAGIHEEGYILKKGQSIPLELEGCAVAGHVTVCSSDWWAERLDRDNVFFRRDLVEYFKALVPPEVIRNWLLNLILVLEKF